MLRQVPLRHAILPQILLGILLGYGPVTESLGQTIPAAKISSTSGGLNAELKNFGEFGTAIANIGDLDNDGVDELVVGAPGRFQVKRPGVVGDSLDGVWILFINRDGSVRMHQRLNAFSGSFNNARPTDLTDGFGFAVSGLGDLDGDGVEDIVVAAPADTRTGRQGVETGRQDGAIYIIFLNEDGTTKGHNKISEGDFQSAPPGGDLPMFGLAVANLGDVDGDGVTDLAVGEPRVEEGLVRIIFLNKDGSVKSHTNIWPTAGVLSGAIRGVSPARPSRFGTHLVGVGDFDNDGTPDLVATAPDNSLGPDAFMLFLNPDGTVRSHRGSDIEIWPEGFDIGNFVSTGLGLLGDLDGDGIVDLAHGSAILEITRKGSAWVVFMAADGSVRTLERIDTEDPGVSIDLARNDRFGTSVVGIGDLNGDGVVDLAIGAPGDDDGGVDRGAVYILFSLPSVASQIDLVELTDRTGVAPILGEDVLVEAEISGISDVASAEINFRRGGDPSFFSAPMSAEGASAYSFSIPAFAVSARGVEYFITTTNSAGTESRAPSSGVISIPVSVADGLTSALPSGVAADAYRLVSVPLNLDEKSARTVLEDDLGPYDETVWRFYSVERPSNLVELNVEDPDLEPGRAFWMLTREGNRVYNSGPGVSVRTDTLFPIRLEFGWNFVGNPFVFPIPMSNVGLGSDEQVGAAELWEYRGSWDVELDTLLPFTGYAVFSDGLDTLWINPDLSAGNVLRQPSTVNRPQPSRERQAELEAMMSKLGAGQFGNGDHRPPTIDHRLGAYPNPFTDRAIIAYDLSEARQVLIQVFDALGRRVATLVEEPQEAGPHQVEWNGRSEAGVLLAAGVYYFRIGLDGSGRSRKLVLSR